MSSEHKINRMATLVVEWIELGQKPSMRKVIQRIGGGRNAKWLNEGFAAIKQVSNNFTDTAAIKQCYKIQPLIGTENVKKYQRIMLNMEQRLLSLQQHNLELQNELRSQQQAAQKYQGLYQAHVAEREAILADIVQKKDGHIQFLQQQVLELNTKHLERYRDAGRKTDDTIMELKLDIVNLTDKLASVSKKLELKEEQVAKLKQALEQDERGQEWQQKLANKEAEVQRLLSKVLDFERN